LPPPPISWGVRYEFRDTDGDMIGAGASAAGAVIVASEPVTRRQEDWTTVPLDHVLTIDADLSIALSPIADPL